MPMVLLPPPWFSTITGCFNRSVSCWPTRRARMSAPPPAAYGTMILMGLEGYSCAAAGAMQQAAASRAAQALRMRVIIVVVLVGVRVSVRPVAVVVVVHQLLRHVREHL